MVHAGHIGKKGYVQSGFCLGAGQCYWRHSRLLHRQSGGFR